MKLLFVLPLLLFLTILVPAQEKLKHAVDLYRAGKYEDAVSELEKLNSSGAGNEQSYLYLGAAYAQLGKEQEARLAFFRANKLVIVKDLDGETPLKVTKKKAPAALGIGYNYANGYTILAVEFKPDKTIGLTFVVQTTTKEWVKNCIEVARKIKFEPATSQGKPVAVIKLVEYTFERY